MGEGEYAMMRDGNRKEGLWRSRIEPDLPMPVTDVDWPERAAFLERLEAVERDARKSHYKGFSICRVCDEVNGSSSFTLDGWEWPDGLAHYLRDHGVRPSADFEAFVLSRDVTAKSPAVRDAPTGRRPSPSFPSRHSKGPRP